MLGFISIVLIIVVFVSLNNKISLLTKELENLKNQKKINGSQVLENHQAEKNISTQSVEADQTVISVQAENIEQNKSVEQQNFNQNQQEDREDKLNIFLNWLVIDWPMKTGAFFLILAAGWFVTYAFINDWIGPIGRVSIGLIFGAVLLVSGAYISRKLQAQGNALSLVGAITVLITIFAGMEFYNFFSPIIALSVMFVIIVFLALIALYQKNKAFAISVLILGGIVPGLFFNEAEEIVVMFYLFVLSAGTIWLVKNTEWKILNFLALLIVAFYSILLELIMGFDESWQNILFVFIFTGLFFGANLTTIIIDRVAKKFDLIVSGIIGVVFLYWILIIVPEELAVNLLLLGALIFAISSFIVFKLTQLKQPVLIYAGVSLMLIISATALQFEGSVLTAAYLLEFSTLISVSLYLFRNQLNKKSLYMFSAVLFMLPVLMSLENVDNLLSAKAGFLGIEEIADLFIVALVIIMSLIIAVATGLFVCQNQNEEESDAKYLAGFFYSVFGVYGMIIIWAVLRLTMEQAYFASMISLIIYTIIGMIFYVKGKKTDYTTFKIVGGLFFGFVIARLLLVEFWQMDIVAKIITFFVIGALFISTSFIKKNQILN